MKKTRNEGQTENYFFKNENKNEKKITEKTVKYLKQ